MNFQAHFSSADRPWRIDRRFGLSVLSTMAFICGARMCPQSGGIGRGASWSADITIASGIKTNLPVHRSFSGSSRILSLVNYDIVQGSQFRIVFAYAFHEQVISIRSGYDSAPIQDLYAGFDLWQSSFRKEAQIAQIVAQNRCSCFKRHFFCSQDATSPPKTRCNLRRKL